MNLPTRFAIRVNGSSIVSRKIGDMFNEYYPDADCGMLRWNGTDDDYYCFENNKVQCFSKASNLDIYTLDEFLLLIKSPSIINNYSIY